MYIERTDEEIVEAWRRWLGQVSSPDEKTARVDASYHSPRELVELLGDSESWSFQFHVTDLRESAKENGDDPVAMINRRVGFSTVLS